MQKLSHKYCLKLNEVYESENSIYLILDLIEAGNLRMLMNKLKND